MYIFCFKHHRKRLQRMDKKFLESIAIITNGFDITPESIFLVHF